MVASSVASASGAIPCRLAPDKSVLRTDFTLARHLGRDRARREQHDTIRPLSASHRRHRFTPLRISTGPEALKASTCEPIPHLRPLHSEDWDQRRSRIWARNRISWFVRHLTRAGSAVQSVTEFMSSLGYRAGSPIKAATHLDANTRRLTAAIATSSGSTIIARSPRSPRIQRPGFSIEAWPSNRDFIWDKRRPSLAQRQPPYDCLATQDITHDAEPDEHHCPCRS